MLELAAAAVIVIALNAYLVLGGADFGGGVWVLFARGPRAERQRALIRDSIGPIWEANHVWLIVVVTVMFTAFPPAFARIMTALHVPLLLALLGVVARGAAFAFRAYEPRPDLRRTWERTFAEASLATPLLLGVAIGALSQGLPSAFSSPADFIRPWLGFFPFLVGLFVLAMVAFLAGVYLTVEAPEEDLREDFRRRSLAAAVAVGVLAAAVLYAAGSRVPELQRNLTQTAWAAILHAATAVAALGAIAALWRRAWRTARVFVVTQVSLIVWGWALSQYPDIVRPGLSLYSAAAPRATLQAMLAVLAAGALLLLPSFYYLFLTFGKLAGRRGSA